MILKRAKAIVLLSGGLDSTLAVKILQSQGIKVLALSFESYFFNANSAKKAAKNLNFPLKVIDFSKKHLKVVKNPKHGYGKGANPCIDCHLLMLKEAKKVMKKKGFDFAATGEVLGERPMSQNSRALAVVEKESGLCGLLLRPLSARLMKETIAERKGLVKREKLFDISGRSRKKQMALAKKMKIKEYPSPSGGCILTDINFSKKLFELSKKFPKFKGNDIKLLRIGRHFWQGKTKIVVGRREEENAILKKMAKKGDIIIEPQNFPGPTVLQRAYGKGRGLAAAKKLLKKYAKVEEKNLKYQIFKK